MRTATTNSNNVEEEIKPMNQQAYKLIKGMIINQQLFPGQKLIYRDLSEKLGMSNTPIINALNMLEKEGLLISKKNRGFYLPEINPNEVEQILDLRAKLEELTLDYAIENYDSNDLSILRMKLKAYEQYESEIYDNERRSLDTEFHMQIANMSKNFFLIEIMKRFYEKMYLNINVYYFSPFVEKFKKEHDMLFKAIKAKDIEKAKEIVRNHNREAKKFLRSMSLA